MLTKGEETKLRIIQLAAPVFNQQGYAGAAISDIMAATGLKKGGIYRHFENKDDLALQAFDYAVNVANEYYWRPTIAQHRHAIDRLVAVIDAFEIFESDETAIPGGCPVMNTAIESDDTHPALKARAQEAMRVWYDTLVQVVERGMKRDEVRADVDAQMVATLIISTMEGGLMLTRLHDDRQYLRRACDYLRQMATDLAPA